MSDFLSNLKAGDEVAIFAGSFNPPKLSTVAKQTPAGQIVLANGDRFNSRGYKLGDKSRFIRQYLANPTEAVRDKIRRNELINSLSGKLRRLENLDTPTLERIAAAIGEGSC